jgi:hypothetical protein
MAIVVVGGSGRGVGKTALVCGVIAALPEFGWIAVKVASHAHAGLPPVYEELDSRDLAAEELAVKESNGKESRAGESAGLETDTARYLASGARRAFLVAATDDEVDERIGERLSELLKLLGPEPNLIFESNRVLRFLEPDLCLAIAPEAGSPRKSSFGLVERVMHACVRRAKENSAEQFIPGPQPEFQLAEFERLSEPMQQWMRERVSSLAPRSAALRQAARRRALA